MQPTVPRRALEGFILQKKLTPRKLRNLVNLANTAERLATRDYLDKAELDGIVGRFGVAPDVTTWGDFFAAEVAADHWEKSEPAFERICETVIFDFVAASLVFSDKPTAFYDSVMEQYNSCVTKESGLRTAEDEEKIHLGIMAGYFHEMGLRKNRLSPDDMEFFDSFSVKIKAS
jgi:hypothetical protein